MRAKVDIVLMNWRRRRAFLTDEHPACRNGNTVVVIPEGFCLANDVRCVGVRSNCPLALFDAAIESGFLVLGTPGYVLE
jgi:hypothetical protein